MQMKTKKLIIISTMLLVGLFGGAWFFLFYPINQFPKPLGPYGVGTTQYHWIDEKRQEPNAFDVQHPNRELMVYIFYPTYKHDYQEPYNQDQVVGYKVVLSYASKLPTWMFSGLDFLKVHEYPNAPLAATNKKLPVIIVSHGWGALVHGWTWFCEVLASHGYFVVGINHPYVAQVTHYPDGRAIETLVFKRAAERKQEGEAQQYRTWKENQVEVCAQDISSAINKLEEFVTQGSMFWSKYIDLNRIGVMGGSFGGTTAMRAYRKDSRIKSCVDMDGCLRGEDVSAEFTKQCLMIIGSASNQWFDEQGEKDLAAIKVQHERYPNTFHLAVIDGAGHGVFSDIPFYAQTTLFLQLFARSSNFYQTAPQQKQVSHGAITHMLAILESQVLGFFNRTLG